MMKHDREKEIIRASKKWPTIQEVEDQLGEVCDICIFWKFGQCHALGDTSKDGDCPSFKD